MTASKTREYPAIVTERFLGQRDLIMTSSWTSPEGDPNLLITLRGEEVEKFKLLVRKGLNCWDNAPASLKEFGDIVTEGKILQDYTIWDKKGT